MNFVASGSVSAASSAVLACNPAVRKGHQLAAALAKSRYGKNDTQHMHINQPLCRGCAPGYIHRVECVLQLKADTEAAAALIRGQNERRAAETARQETEHEAEKEQLAAKGLNPYKVYACRRRRRVCFVFVRKVARVREDRWCVVPVPVGTNSPRGDLTLSLYPTAGFTSDIFLHGVNTF